MKERKLTIFTPIYNRAYCLNNCYQSMRRQKNKRFVWIIVDDGSTDNLESLVSEWIVEESEFQIEYYRKENGGMYTAYLHNFLLFIRKHKHSKCDQYNN